MATVIHPKTAVGPVHLRVRDLDRAVTWYTERLGFALRQRDAGEARLGACGAELLVLHAAPRASRVRGTTGLYHFAILVPSRRALADVLAHLLATRTPLSGASDHLVSEALYLSDPEGNGIEIYRDRPRAEWTFTGGEVAMGTDPLDVEGLLAERGRSGEAWAGLPAGTTIGHVHLHVSDLDAAERFYVGVLGFERMLRFGPSALFVAAGGYHHHLGLNTWAGAGAPAPPPGATGLDHFVVRLPDAAELARVADRVRAAGVEVETRDGGVQFADPSQNHIALEIEGGGHTS